MRTLNIFKNRNVKIMVRSKNQPITQTGGGGGGREVAIEEDLSISIILVASLKSPVGLYCLLDLLRC